MLVKFMVMAFLPVNDYDLCPCSVPAKQLSVVFFLSSSLKMACHSSAPEEWRLIQMQCLSFPYLRGMLISECLPFVARIGYKNTSRRIITCLVIFSSVRDFTMALAILVILYTYLALATALTNEAWRSQSIYQLLTDRYARTDGSTTACSDLGKYCGGTWQGIINKLDYIQSMGFTAIWISPITEQIQGTTHYGDAFHGFWPQKINEVNANFGTVGDLQALSAALHQRGMVGRSVARATRAAGADVA